MTPDGQTKAWRETLADAVAAAAVKATLRIHPDTGHVQMTQALRATGMAVAEGAHASVALQHATIALQWATVLLAEGRIDPTLVPLVCAVYNAALAPLAGTEILGIVPQAPTGDVLVASAGAPVARLVELELDVPVASAPAATRAPEPSAPGDVEIEDDETREYRKPSDDDFAVPEDEPEEEEPPPARRPPAPDWEPDEGVREPGPPIVVTARRAITADDFYYDVVELALEKLGPLGRRARTGPSSEWASVEHDMLALTDVVLASSSACVRHVRTFWERSLAFPSPWGTYAACFALGCIDGPESLVAIRDGLRALPPDAESHGMAAARALVVAPHPHVLRLARDLASAEHPVLRAIGIEVLADRGALSPEALSPHLHDANLPVLVAATRIASRLPLRELSVVSGPLARWLTYPERRVAMAAAIGVLRTGDERPLHDVRMGGPIAGILGADALEILVLRGDASDLPVVEAIVADAKIDADVLDALARFGHPGLWAFLAHHLEDEDLVDDAAEALEVLFGARVEGAEGKLAGAWRSAVAEARLDPGVRYRRGVPFGPGVVADECLSGKLPETAIERRWAELSVRAGVDARPRFAGWSTVRVPQVHALAASGRAAQGAYPKNGWR